MTLKLQRGVWYIQHMYRMAIDTHGHVDIKAL